MKRKRSKSGVWKLRKFGEQNASKEKYETEEAAIKAVSEATEIDIPSGMIETETDNMIKDIEQRLSYQGLKLDQYLQIMNKSEEDMRKELEEQAKISVKTKLVIEAIVAAEKIEATEEEVNAKLEEMATMYGSTVEELSKNESLKLYIEETVKSEKAVAFIVENAKIK